MSLIHGVTAGLLILMIGLQIINFVKFRKSNGANYMRILVFTSTVFMLVHTVRLTIGHFDGSFLMASVVAYLFIYFNNE